jgi:3-dehydroquinate dehydratase-1
MKEGGKIAMKRLPLNGKCRIPHRHGRIPAVMKTVQFGALSVGQIPRVVGTILSLDSLRKFGVSTRRFCDLAEARVDEIGPDSPWPEECRHIEASGTPVIATLRAAGEGGKSRLPDRERLDILRRALDDVSAIDVELKSELAEPLSQLARTRRKAVIVSFHDFEGTPPYSGLEAILKDIARFGAVAKVSTIVKSPLDIDTLNRLLAQDWGVPLCVIGMGDPGSSTRTSFPALGSCLTYGYLDTPAAPGQLSARTLVEHLCATIPAYNQDHLNRK